MYTTIYTTINTYVYFVKNPYASHLVQMDANAIAPAQAALERTTTDELGCVRTRE